MQVMIRTALGATAAMAVLISCAQSPGNSTTRSPATTAAPAPTSTSPATAAKPVAGASFAVIRELDGRAVARPVDRKIWDRDLILATTWKNTLPKNAAVHDLTNRGGLLISQADPAIKDGIVTLRPGKVSIWSPDGKLRLLDDATGRPKPVRQSANGQMHGGDATWFDTTSTDLFQQDWQIRYYDSRSRTTRLIADSNAVFPGVKEPRPPPHDTIPVLSDDGTIYWAAAAPDKNAHLGFTGVILARDSKARGPVRTIARKATLPTIVGSTLYYARLDDVSPDTPAKKVEIHAVTPGGKDRVVVTAPLVKNQQILRLTASATHLVWVISDTDRQAEPSPDLNEGRADTKYQGCSLYVKKHSTNQATRIKLHSYSANPKLSPTLLGWGGSSSPGDTGEYVMDLASNKIWRVGAARGCSEVTLAGPYARWFTATPDGQCAGQLIVRWRTPQ